MGFILDITQIRKIGTAQLGKPSNLDRLLAAGNLKPGAFSLLLVKERFGEEITGSSAVLD